MAEWKCENCGYTMSAERAPDQCPSCKQKCEFLDISCYIPDCGPQGSDNRLK